MKEKIFFLRRCLNKIYGFYHRGLLALIALFVFLLFSIFFLIIDPMFRSAADPSLVDLQLAFSALRFREIIVGWNQSVNGGVEIYKLSIILLDYLYPLIYSIMLAFAYAAVRGNQLPRRFDRIIFVLPFCGALFDYAENTFHLFLLKNVHNLAQAASASYAGLPVALSFACSILKFVFFSGAILSLAGAVVCRLKKKFT